MPAKTDFSSHNCSLARGLAQMGDGWSLLIIRDAVLGLSRFGEFQRHLGIARNILADRLTRLVATGLLERRGRGNRPTYHATGKALALAPALIALQQWGDHYASADVPPVVMRDIRGNPVLPLTLATRAGPVDAADLRFHPGPGANAETRAGLSQRLKPPRAAPPHPAPAPSAGSRYPSPRKSRARS